MCVVRNRKTNNHSTTRDAMTTSVLRSNNRSVVATKVSTQVTTPLRLSNNNFKNFKVSSNVTNTPNENDKIVKGKISSKDTKLEIQTPNRYINSHHAIKGFNANVKEELTQENDNVHLYGLSRKQDPSESHNLDRLLENTQITEKIGIFNECSSSVKKKQEQTNDGDDEDDEPYEIVQDATILNEDDTLYGIEKIMPEFHL